MDRITSRAGVAPLPSSGGSWVPGPGVHKVASGPRVISTLHDKSANRQSLPRVLCLIGYLDLPDAAVRNVADFIGTEHHAFEFTVQEGIAISDVIYHLEIYDVTTIRAGNPINQVIHK